MGNRVAALLQVALLPGTDVFPGAADETHRQRLGDVLVEFVAGNLADDVLFGNGTDLLGFVCENVNDVVQVAFIKRRQAHRNDESLGFEAEAHRLHVPVERGPVREAGFHVALARFRVDGLLAADFGFHGDEAPADFDVVLAGLVHALGVLVAVVVHPFLEGLGRAGLEDGDFVHPDGFFFDDADFVIDFESARRAGRSGTLIRRIRFEFQIAVVGIDDDLRRVDGRPHVRENVIGNLAEFGHARERDQHPEFLDFALEARVNHERLDTVLVEHERVLITRSRDRCSWADVDRRDHPAGISRGGGRNGKNQGCSKLKTNATVHRRISGGTADGGRKRENSPQNVTRAGAFQFPRSVSAGEFSPVWRHTRTLRSLSVEAEVPHQPVGVQVVDR